MSGAGRSVYRRVVSNRDVAETYREAIAKINALTPQPAFVLHTGDLTHLAKPEEFDAVDQLHRTIRAGEIYCCGKTCRKRWRSTRLKMPFTT